MAHSLSPRRGAAIVLTVTVLCLPGCARDPSISHGNIQVVYTGGTTQAEAERLGAHLGKQLNAAQGKAKVQISKAGDCYHVRLVAEKDVHTDAKKVEALGLDTARMSRDVFAGERVEIHLCDAGFNILATAPIPADMRFGMVENKIECFFATAQEKADAERMVRYFLNELKFGTGASLKLAKQDKGATVHFVVAPDKIDDKATRAIVHAIAWSLSNGVFDGLPVEMHVCDAYFKTVYTVRSTDKEP